MDSWAFIGRVGRDAEVSTSKNGKEITKFSVALDRGFKDSKTAVWVNCIAFGDRWPNVAGYILKGNEIGIIGEPSVNTWEDRDGKMRADLQCVVRDVTLIKSGKRDDAERPAPSRRPSDPPPVDDDMDSIPF